jgi:uncharacterized lipoprotein YddW (UPF0748 family)
MEASKNAFTKAMWVHIGASFPNGARDVPYVLDKWADAGFKLLILRIRMSDGKPLFQRTIHPVADIARDWDPVGIIDEEARKRGMRVHPWCQVFRGGESEFARSNAGYLGVNRDGQNVDHFLCAAQDAVQDWSYSFYEELMDNYETAGIHLDFIRYAGYTCYCDYCRQTFRRETGIEMDMMEKGSAEWARWISQRVNNINRFVRRIKMEAAKRNKELSAAVYASYPHCIESVGQDWLNWAHEKWVDFVLPMNYYGDEDRFKQNAQIHIGGVNRSIPVFEGVALNLPRRPWEIKLSPEQLLERSQSVKDMGFQGICYFVSQHLTDEHLEWIKKL